MGIVAKYKFDGSVYTDLIPEFNTEFTDYTITDEVDSENSNHIIRTIESDSLPTLMRFGVSISDTPTDRELCLLEIIELDTTELTSCNRMFISCQNVTSINTEGWTLEKVTDMYTMFYSCYNLTTLDVSNWKTCNVTDMSHMFEGCELTSIDISNWDTSKVTNMSFMFSYCCELTSLDVSNWKTGKVTDMSYMFDSCEKLTSIDVSNFDTSKVTSMESMFCGCNKLTSLDVSNFDTSNVTNMTYMFYHCNKLTSLDVSNFDTSNVTDMSDMFTNTNNLKYLKCNNVNTLNALNTLLPAKSSDNQGTIICKSSTTNLDTTTLQSINWTINTNPTLIAKYKYDSKIYKNLIPVFNKGYMGFVEDEEVDENGVVTRVIEHVELPTYMRFGETWETSQNQPTWRSSSLIELLQINDSNIANFSDMFKCCDNLRNVCKLNLNGIALVNTFFRCYNLEKLDLSNNTFSNVENINYIFSECAKLISLDISNFNLNKCRGFDNVFTNNISLKDIGMIYCDKSTINKVASLLPTDHNITIWVESDDILQYDQYDHITYKTQKVQDTVHLNSPLLIGDTIEVIDGKTYHVHRWEKVVLDGSEDWNSVVSQTIGNSYLYQTSAYNDTIVSENIIINILCDKMNTTTANKNWSNTVLKNGISLNKYGTISIRCENITSVNDLKTWLSNNILNVIAPLVTPYYELISEEPLELTLLDTTDNTINNNSILPSNMTIANKELSTIAIKPSTTYTLSFDKSNVDSEVTIDICGGEQITTVLNRIELTTPSELGSGIRFISSDGCIISNVRLLEGSLVKEAIPKETFEGLKSSFEDGYIIGENLAVNTNRKTLVGSTGDRFYYTQTNIIKDTVYTVYCKLSNIINVSEFKAVYSVNGSDETPLLKSNISKDNNTVLKSFVARGNSNLLLYIDSHAGQLDVSDLVILEGDHTHLSEAELMRYIEKGTSHYEEEDYNHVGKYKVQYKVTGKNKFDVNSLTSTSNNFIVLGDEISINTPSQYCLMLSNKLDLIPGNEYVLQGNLTPGSEVSIRNSKGVSIAYLGDKVNSNNYQSCKFIATEECYFRCSNRTLVSTDVKFSNIQLEEGTVATEYEPYKEDIKTYYLSSPLLEEDTIEDINGVATHVKRYGKVVLDGNIRKMTGLETYGDIDRYSMHYAGVKTDANCICDKLIVVRGDNEYAGLNKEIVAIRCSTNLIWTYTRKGTYNRDEINRWFQQNPTTVVYELSSPIYEPISTESILCDSYVNGHLDFDSTVPVEMVKFHATSLPLKYLHSDTKYIVQFESDNIGVMDILKIGNWSVPYFQNTLINKGINRFVITTFNNLTANFIAIYGIGFNASNIQVVEANEDIEFDYFKGLQSSFENGLVTDENDENYGKYKVECKIVGKNKFNGELEYGRYNYINGIKDANDNTSYMRFPKLIPIKNGSVRATVFGIDGDVWFVVYNTNGGYIDFGKAYDLSRFDGRVGYISFYMVQPSFADNWYIQLEEGIQATSYEPYKESIHTLYLNSPLLKGDKLVVHDGKLCHYHKMGMVVLDGSENWRGNYIFSDKQTVRYMTTDISNIKRSNSMYCNILPCATNDYQGNECISVLTDGNLRITLSKAKASTEEMLKQWLQANPTTVVYELAEPYYEPIEPQLSQYSFSTVKDGDMEIITVLPIEKINLTYRTDINGVSSIEEQIASIQEGTDISSIIDEEVDE